MGKNAFWRKNVQIARFNLHFHPTLVLRDESNYWATPPTPLFEKNMSKFHNINNSWHAGNYAIELLTQFLPNKISQFLFINSFCNLASINEFEKSTSCLPLSRVTWNANSFKVIHQSPFFPQTGHGSFTRICLLKIAQLYSFKINYVVLKPHSASI